MIQWQYTIGKILILRSIIENGCIFIAAGIDLGEQGIDGFRIGCGADQCFVWRVDIASVAVEQESITGAVIVRIIAAEYMDIR